MTGIESRFTTGGLHEWNPHLLLAVAVSVDSDMTMWVLIPIMPPSNVLDGVAAF